MTPEKVDIPDQPVRRLAETTFDRNVVVVAGAGTGKTTLLVNRLIHLLMREPHAVGITRLVALTFTNKAATEMKIRLRERLRGLLEVESPSHEPGTVTVADLRERYGVSREVIETRVKAALRDLDKAQIGTLHSFAAHVLRLYPLESGVDPNFQTDDGESQWDEHFATQWDCWLDRELVLRGPNTARWRRVLAQQGVDGLREMAQALRSELIPLGELGRETGKGLLPPALRNWLMAKCDRATALLAGRPQGKPQKADTMLRAAQTVCTALVDHGLAGVETLDASCRAELARELGSKTAKWSEADFAEAAQVIRAAQQALAIDHALMQDLLALLCPFIEQCRASFVAQGWVSFDGLLARACALLHAHPGIRERLKHDYQVVLVDEFQDTDPVQYEIILYLAEQAGQTATDWRAVELEPGKLFIVGDPKQSIYAFRRADIEAFEQVVRKITATGGLVYELTTNFRSDKHVLDVVNPLFDRLLVRQENIQPQNVPLVVRPQRAHRMAEPGVHVRIVKTGTDGEAVESATATRFEAEQLATWLKEKLIGHEILTDASGRREPLKPGHVALLFRKLTQAQDYLEALRRHDIAYITDGEKHFYKRQEVIDLINVLRVVENPHDAIAMTGLLRSSLGGLPDREVDALCQLEAFDYRQAERLARWDSPHAGAMRDLYARLLSLHQAAPRVPLPDAMELVFSSLPVLELAAASLHGEQAVANLLKVRQMAAEVAARPQVTLSAFVELMIVRLDEQPDEAESALAEDSLDAVRVLTIHKAKGLEFPVVVLPGFHHGAGRGRELPLVAYDWATGVYGLNWEGRCNAGAVLVNEKVRLREEAERRRLFYVGMTRARERLVLSGGWPSQQAKGTFFSLLREAATGELGADDLDAVQIGPVPLAQTVVMAGDRAPKRRRAVPTRLRASPEWPALAKRWAQRDAAWEAIRTTPVHLTPTSLRVEKNQPVGVRSAGTGERSRLVGTLAHCVLQCWQFDQPADQLAAHLQAVCTQLEDKWRGCQEELMGELREMFETFLGSDVYGDLQRAEIIGREVPFLMPWEGNGPGGMDHGADHAQANFPLSSIAYHPSPVPSVMEGVIDVLYRLDGRVRVADYKTDQVEDSELVARVATYAPQVQVYRAAVSKCLGLADVGADIIFLRHGTSVSL